MKLALYLPLTLIAFFTFIDKTFALTNYQINKICYKERKASTCIKNLRKKKYDLEKGNVIKIPTKPYKR